MRRLGSCCSCGPTTSTGTCACAAGDHRFLPTYVSIDMLKLWSGLGSINVNIEYPTPPANCTPSSWTLATASNDKQYEDHGAVQMFRWDPTGVPTTGGVVGIDYPEFRSTGMAHSECWYVYEGTIETGEGKDYWFPCTAQTSGQSITGECVSNVSVGGPAVTFYGRDVQKVWFNASTEEFYVVPKYVIYPEFLNILRSDMTNPPPPTGSIFESVLIAHHEFLYGDDTPWFDQGFGPKYVLDVATFTEDYACAAEFPNDYIGWDLDLDWRDQPDGIGGVVDNTANSKITIQKDVPCSCWGNEDGGGCNPFTADCNVNPVSNMTLLRDGLSTVTQNADSFWLNNTTIRVPVDTDMGLGDFFIDMNPAGTNNPILGAGRYIEFWDNGFTNGEVYLLDSCEGNIRGDNQQNANTYFTFDSNNWSDCRS